MPETEIRIGRWTIVPDEHSLRAPGGARVSIEPRTMAVLMVLVRKRDRLVTRDELLASAWPGLFVTDDALYRCIHQLRTVFAATTGPSPSIVTIRGRGYRLEVPAGTTTMDRDAVQTRPRRTGSRLTRMFVVIAAALCLPAVLSIAPSRPDRPAAGLELMSVRFLDEGMLGTGRSTVDPRAEPARTATPATADSVIQGLRHARPDLDWTPKPVDQEP